MLPFEPQLQLLQTHFKQGNTLSISFRKQQLLALKQNLLKHEQAIYEALFIDLKKEKEETYITELGFVLNEINYCLKNLNNWAKPKRVSTNLLNLPSSSYIYNEPKGVVLIIGPWNYPLQLLLTPLVGAIAAGNTVVLKPSEFANSTATLLKKIIAETFASNYVLYVEGDGALVIPAMMSSFVFDHVFYTGSTSVGKIINQLAAPHLVPTTLELGGKSPAVITSTANLHVSAKRIAVVKFSNCGQMCVAPDYILVHESVKEKFVNELKQTIKQFYNPQSTNANNYGKIINEKQFNRLVGHLTNQNIIVGGNYDAANLYIEPTLIDSPSLESSIMQNEIFGPLLPIYSYKTNEEALAIIEQHKNPLAFYVFSQNKQEQEFWLQQVPSGGACVNNCSWHLTNHHLPFGGRGNSGLGNYHGKYSFTTFSHQKAVLKTPTWFNPAIKFPPFAGKLQMLKKFLG